MWMVRTENGVASLASTCRISSTVRNVQPSDVDATRRLIFTSRAGFAARMSSSTALCRSCRTMMRAWLTTDRERGRVVSVGAFWPFLGAWARLAFTSSSHAFTSRRVMDLSGISASRVPSTCVFQRLRSPRMLRCSPDSSRASSQSAARPASVSEG
ncbi:MAG: hypothetical protein IPN17_30655 [Deltaproteobacteria bacterium]|nr:hypothetical protein [Deltaproteobacteria bacterium]